jgi:hypothetical protein
VAVTNVVSRNDVVIGSMQVSFQDILEYIGKTHIDYRAAVGVDGEQQRFGQWFFNSLSPEDARKIAGTLYDPFYSNEKEKVKEALAFLLLKED